MIIGIGSDLIDIRRIAKVIERHGDRFLDRIFTDAERARAERRANSEKMVVATYAKRFAAKEACAKALGTGIRRGVWWRDMGVVNLPGGPSDHEADRRRAGPAGGADAGGLRGADRSVASPTNGRWRRPSSSFRRSFPANHEPRRRSRRGCGQN